MLSFPDRFLEAVDSLGVSSLLVDVHAQGKELGLLMNEPLNDDQRVVIENY